jgi:mannonate dehydratase
MPELGNRLCATGRAQAERMFAAMDTAARERLERRIIAGLRGSEESFSARDFQTALDLRRHRCRAPCARTTPPSSKRDARLRKRWASSSLSILTIPRCHCSACRGWWVLKSDLADLFEAVPFPANGLCYCGASFSLHPGNDVVRIVERFSDRIGFAHLRSVAHEPDHGLYEPAHLEAIHG